MIKLCNGSQRSYSGLQRLIPCVRVKMIVDNTPDIKNLRRKPTSQMRVRLETAKKLQYLGARARKKRAKAKVEESKETDPEKMIQLAPRPPRLKKNTLSKPEKPGSKFRKRQIHKAWLPTHIYHTKRAHMTEPKHPLWRFAIPLTPTEKSYRKTHRAGAARGCVAWDMSYMSTIGVEGWESSLLGLLRCLGVEESALTGQRAVKWRRGTRSWHGWVREREKETHWIADVHIVWCAEDTRAESNEDGSPMKKKKKAKRKFLLRVHPSAFLQLWTEVLKVAKMQRPPAMVEDLRFEIGSIQIVGPESTETLVSTLQPIQPTHHEPMMDDHPGKSWSSLGSVTNPSSLPPNAILGFNASDPRLRCPPQPTVRSSSAMKDDALLQLLSTWPPDVQPLPPSLFDRTARMTACRLLPSQKAINRRKGAAPLGSFPDPLPADPTIPVLLLVNRNSFSGGQGSWTLLLPWKCVLPVWYYLVHYPVSTGGNPRFGGLNEQRQLCFEQGVPWFPGDFPGTKAGSEWETREADARKAEWEKRPKGKRIEWSSVDLGESKKGEIGLGWACDWEFLFNGSTGTSAQQPHSTENQRPAAGTESAADPTDPSTTSLPTPPPNLTQIPYPLSSTIYASAILPSSSHALTSIHLTLLHRGHPTSCARIYRLPTSSPDLRQKWVTLASSLLFSSSKPPKDSPKASKNSSDLPDPKFLLASVPRNQHSHLRTQATAISLLSKEDRKDAVPRPGDAAYPCVPGAEDLIGFVTTGNFDLGRGKCAAIGNIALARVLHQEVDTVGEEKAGKGRESAGKVDGRSGKGGLRKLCIIRDAGQSLGRLARWEFV